MFEGVKRQFKRAYSNLVELLSQGNEPFRVCYWFGQIHILWALNENTIVALPTCHVSWFHQIWIEKNIFWRFHFILPIIYWTHTTPVFVCENHYTNADMAKAHLDLNDDFRFRLCTDAQPPACLMVIKLYSWLIFWFCIWYMSNHV